MRKSLLGLSLLALTATAAPAAAQDADSSITISGEATIVSDYRFRGVSLSDEDFAVQMGITATHDSGLYVGTWGSSLTNGAYGAAEIDVYGGYSTEITDGLTVDVGGIYYIYPDAVPGDANYGEVYGSLGTTLGPVEASIGAAYTWDSNSITEGLYLYTDAGVGIPNTPVTLTAHVGRQTFDVPEDNDYFDFALGAEASYDVLTFGVKWVATDIKPKAVREAVGADSAVVFSVSAGF